MRDQDCIAFLHWCLPRLRLRWPGYRRVRRTVCKRIARRLRELGLDGLDAYRRYLEASPLEWPRLDAFCRIPISRFYRDRAVFEALGRGILPDLARQAEAEGRRELRAWSAGCASGEEAYSLRLVWDFMVGPNVPDMRLSVLGTDAEPEMLRRAEAACYTGGSLRDLPPAWIAQAFAAEENLFRLLPTHRHDIEFWRQDIRETWPAGRFDLILCRNLVFTYFEPALQEELLIELDRRLQSPGYLVIGAHERLPEATARFQEPLDKLPIYRKAGPGS
jgi:chemotaxis protein methyltransferase CheR